MFLSSTIFLVSKYTMAAVSVNILSTARKWCNWLVEAPEYMYRMRWYRLLCSNIIGVHLNMAPLRMRSLSVFARQLIGEIFPSLIYSPAEIRVRSSLKETFFHILRESGYMHIQATKPDTVGKWMHLLDTLVRSWGTHPSPIQAGRTGCEIRPKSVSSGGDRGNIDSRRMHQTSEWLRRWPLFSLLRLLGRKCRVYPYSESWLWDNLCHWLDNYIGF